MGVIFWFFFFGTIWKECNQRTFEGVQHINQSLKDSLISNVYIWSRSSFIVDGQIGPLSLIDFIEVEL